MLKRRTGKKGHNIYLAVYLTGKLPEPTISRAE